MANRGILRLAFVTLLLVNLAIENCAFAIPSFRSRRFLLSNISPQKSSATLQNLWMNKFGTKIPEVWENMVSSLSELDVERFKTQIDTKALASNVALASTFCSTANLMCTKMTTSQGLKSEALQNDNMMPVDVLEMMITDMGSNFMQMDFMDMMMMMFDMDMGMNMMMDMMFMDVGAAMEMNTNFEMNNIDEMNMMNMEMNDLNMMDMGFMEIGMMEMGMMDMGFMNMGNMDMGMVTFNNVAHENIKTTTKDETAKSFWFRESDLQSTKRTYNVSEVPAWRFSERKLSFFAKQFLPSVLTQALGDTKVSSIPLLLNQLHISNTSQMARSMLKTAQLCNRHMKTYGGELKGCVTSFEGMIDFMSSLISSPSVAMPLISTAVPTNNVLVAHGSFNVVNVELKSDVASKHGVCHSSIFPYRTEFCHYNPKDKLYTVTLESTTQPGYMITNVATCHTDTSKWSPNHIAFRILGSKAGQESLCHWSQPGQITFYSKSE